MDQLIAFMTFFVALNVLLSVLFGYTCIDGEGEYRRHLARRHFIWSVGWPILAPLWLVSTLSKGFWEELVKIFKGDDKWKS